MGRTVLVVDDDPDIRDVLKLALEVQGYQVETACDGLEALERTHGLQPAVILLDLAMPRMDGSAFARELLRCPHCADVPIIVMSAVPHAERAAADLDARACITKPFDIDEVWETVDRLADAAAGD